GVAVAARLGEVASTGDAEPGGEGLEDDGHDVRNQDDAEERVAVAGAAGEVGGPIARVHVADSDEVAGTGESEHLSPEAGAVGNRDGSVDLGEADRGGIGAPAFSGDGRNFCGHLS